MSGFKCPYCPITMPLDYATHSEEKVYFRYSSNEETEIGVIYLKCPECGQYTVYAVGVGDAVQDIGTVYLRPKSLAIQFPDYVPEAIRCDYEEAYSILNLSPKASATLARRCLQGMIHDFWGIREKNLAKSLEKLSDKISATQRKVIDGIRRLGNIGAHMESDINLIIDIDPDEAQKLLKLIELLIKQWYIERHDQEQLYDDIIAIDEEKQQQRKPEN